MTNANQRRGVPWNLLGAIGFLVLALVLMTRCKPTTPPDEPTYVVVDSGDAAALLDVGADPSPIARMCAVFASQTPPCPEAIYTCVDAFTRMRAKHLIEDLAIGCVASAHDRAGIQACGGFCR